MEHSNLLLLLVIGVSIYCVLWIIYTRRFHPLSRIPGPFWASVTRTWTVYHTMRGDMDSLQRQLHHKHGHLVRIGPDEIVCSDPEAIRKIYPTQRPLTKTDFYPIWGNKTFSKYPDNFSGTDEKLHSDRRRIVNNVYSMSTVLTLEGYIDNCSKLFAERMGAFADEGTVVDLGEWLQWYAFDAIGELFFGRMFGFMQHSQDHESYIESLETLLPVLCAAAIASPVMRFSILGSSMISSSTRKAMKAIDHIAGAARSSVKERREEGEKLEKGRTDLLHHLLRIVEEKGDKVDFGLGEVEYEAYVALFAGSDTTAIAMRSVFYFLMRHPLAYKALQAEIDSASQEGRLSSPPQYSEAIKLPYLSACIKEAMRSHPSVGLSMPRTTPTQGLELCGEMIPRGYKVGMNAAVVAYDKGIYGDDADIFRPERWLDSADAVAKMDRYSLVFGGGTRTCIGKNISLSEIHKLVPYVLQRFDLMLDKPEREWTTQNFWFHKQSGIMVRISRR